MLLKLSDNLLGEVFNFLGAFDLTVSIPISCKYLKNFIEYYASIKLKVVFEGSSLDKFANYQNEAIYGHPKITMRW